MEGYGVVVFRTTTAVMRSEKLLSMAGFQVKIIPVPRTLSTDCCQGLRILWGDRVAVQRALERAGVDYVAVYPLEGG
jgi:hypothetical protein